MIHFELQTRLGRNELIDVSIQETPANFIRRYGLAARGINLAALQRLNPEIQNWANIPSGTRIWLKARQVVVGNLNGFEGIAQRYFRSRYRWPTVWAFNPQFQTPNLTPADRVWLQSQADRNAFGTVQNAPTQAQYTASIRAGTAQVSIDSQGPDDQPIIRVDQRQRATAMANWLASQRFDPRGRTAAVLTRLFTGNRRNFQRTSLRLHMFFLSRTFPNIVDPIFPSDQRFAAHIIHQP